MNAAKITILIYTMIYITNCSYHSNRGRSNNNYPLINVLTSFSIAINENNYEKAINFLIPEERMKLIGENNHVSDEGKRQLNALELQTLIKHPHIKLVNGKLSGVFEYLPILDEKDVIQEENVFENTMAE